MAEVKHTPGPWRLVIDDTGGQWSGWPLCVCPVSDDDRTIVRTGGMWPYEWDAATSQREAVANARLIAAAPDLMETGAELQAARKAQKLSPSAENLSRVRIASDAFDAALARARGEQDGGGE